MNKCSVLKDIEVHVAGKAEYEALSRFHYRSGKLGPYQVIYSAWHRKAGLAGVIVYSMPTSGCELREIATGNFYIGLDRSTRMKLINRDIRRISRVVIEPRFRGLGLASDLVRQTLDRVDSPVVEALTVMGNVSGFFERAGMKAYRGAEPIRSRQMIEAFGAVGIDEGCLLDAEKCHEKIMGLGTREARFINLQQSSFLRFYGKRRDMTGGIERTRFILGKLGERPVYYIWIKQQQGN